MASEEEKRLHRCCFSGHRPEKLDEPEEQVKALLPKRRQRSSVIFMSIQAPFTVQSDFML